MARSPSWLRVVALEMRLAEAGLRPNYIELTVLRWGWHRMALMPERVGIRTLLLFVATASSMCGGM